MIEDGSRKTEIGRKQKVETEIQKKRYDYSNL